jgi:SAM-dependent methyltransferase
VTFANTEQAEFWSKLAPTWVELEDRQEGVLGVPGQMAMDRLALLPGQRVLDLGCGTGRTTLQLASLVGTDGAVLGVDIADEMLSRGREHAAQLGANNVVFLHGDVQVQDLGEASFDAAYSRFGVMFFTDPVAAFANVRKALRPGGRFCFVCWQGMLENEWLLIPGSAVASVTGSLPQMPGPGEPGPFSLADPDRVRTVLETAGFGYVNIEPHTDLVTIPEEQIPEVARTSSRMGAVREMLREVDDDTRGRAITAIEDAFRARLSSGEVRASRGILLVEGRP